MRTATLLPDAEALHLEALIADAERITVVVTTRGEAACCPECGRPSAHLHSRKRRRLADLPWQGLAVCLDLQLRRFYCRTPTCDRRTFTERVPTVVAPYARRTRRLAAVVEAVAFALGGEPGARLLAAEGLALSPDTLYWRPGASAAELWRWRIGSARKWPRMTRVAGTGVHCRVRPTPSPHRAGGAA